MVVQPYRARSEESIAIISASGSITNEKIDIVTAPHTDLWQRTYYHFRNDNAPVLQMKTKEKFFTFVVKTEFDSKHRFDQCGIVLYLNSDNWLKASIEYENEEFQHLGSVVTNRGFSDWATTEIPGTVRSMWYRLSRRNRFRYLCLQSGGLLFQSDLYQSGIDGMQMAAPRWPATG